MHEKACYTTIGTFTGAPSRAPATAGSVGLLRAQHAAGTPGRVPGARTLTGELFGQLQQRVRGTGHHIGRDVDHPSAPVACGRPELLECLTRADAVTLGQYADRLLDADARSQRVFQLANGGAQPVRCGAGGGPGAAGTAGWISVGSSAAIKSASTIAQVRSGRSSSPTRHPSGVRRTTASSPGTGGRHGVVSAVGSTSDAARRRAVPAESVGCWAVATAP